MPRYASIIVALVLLACSGGAASAKSIGYYYQSPEENNRRSQLYDYLLSVNARFRAYRIHKECSPIDDSPLRGDCIGSFDVYEPIQPGYR